MSDTPAARNRALISCVVVPIMQDGRIALVKSSFMGLATDVVGVLKGSRGGGGETEELAARRMLHQLGLSAQVIERSPVAPYLAPGESGRRSRILLARGCRVISGQAAEPYHLVTEEEMAEQLMQGAINDAESCMALQTLLLTRIYPPGASRA